ncbi:MAG: helix-turn-helix domain-containing protein [Acidaminococcaceae bacterium]|nr:helix-turn-helix domain-containing protein [Acidaminococcaceae bacterium]
MLNTFKNGNAAGMVVYQLTEAQVEELASQIAAKIAVNSTQVLPSSPDAAIWISRADAAKRIGISLPTLHGLINRGAVMAQKVGRRTLVNGPDLMSKLASGELAKYKRLPR